MKKKFLLTLFLLSAFYSQAQVICVFCYNQNVPISTGVNNLMVNGGFENGCTTGQYYCPNSSGYSCDFTGWTCTGGGNGTYAQALDGSYDSYVVEGNYAAYFGSSFCNLCNATQGDTSCLGDSLCTATGIDPGYPYNTVDFGGVIGMTLQQTVSGLSPGNTYVLEFWAGGEATPSYFRSAGLFAVDVGFGNIFLRDQPTSPASADIGTRFIIEFNATSASHTIKFTNWGHICSDCTELVVDDVNLYTVAELSAAVTPCYILPTAIFTAPNHICPGTCTQFTNLSVNASSCLWSFQGANPSTSTDINPSNICYNTPGTYPVQLVVTNTYGSDTLTLNNYITVYPYPPPQGILQSGDTLFANPGAVSYQWYFNGNIIPGATDYYYIAPASGDYNVVATDANSCEVEAVIFNVFASVQSQSNGSQLTIFPNPAAETITVSGYRLAGTTAGFSIYNMLGEMVMPVQERAIGKQMEEVLDISQVPPGIYYLQVNNGSQKLRTKFIKQ